MLSFDGLRRDLRYALRGLRASPMFAAVALLTLAVASGANTAVFSVVNSVLLEPLPYPDADELVSIWHDAPGSPGTSEVSGGLRVSPSMYFTYAEQNRTFEQIGLWIEQNANVTGLAQPEEVSAVFVTDGVLQAFGVPPALGRWLGAADHEPGSPRTVLLAHGYWQERFGGDRDAIGRTIEVDGNRAEIVGVMPAGFRIVETAAALIAPVEIDRSQLTLPPFCCQAVARLASGVTLEQANADVARMLPIWLDSWPYRGDARAVYQEGWRITPALRPLKQDVIGKVGSVLWIVMGTIGVVLLIACANVTNLLLVRAGARQRELAVRAALGASAWGITRSLVLESLLLALAGGAIGLGLAFAALEALAALGPANLPRLGEIALDARAFGFTFIVAAVAGLLLGVAPALKHAGPRIAATLHGGGRGSSVGRERHRTQDILVVVQVALALVLLVGSGLMIRTFQALRSVDPGFTAAESLQTLRVAIPAQLEPSAERVVQMQRSIVAAIEAVPGVSSAAFGSAVPLDGSNSDSDGIYAEGQTAEEAARTGGVREFHYVSPGLFATTGTRIVAGRDFAWADVLDRRPAVMVSEGLAREFWGSVEAAVGKRINRGQSGLDAPWIDVIGVVADVRDNGLDQPAPAIVYWPTFLTDFTGNPGVARNVAVVVRSARAGTGPFISELERAVWSVNPSLPLANVRTMRDVYDRSLGRTSFALVMLALAGAVALVLGVVGLYGVISYAVSQRRREIAIRLALGAQQSAVRRTFVRRGVALALVGVVVGAAAAAGVTRLMTSLLYDVRPVDAPTYVGVSVLLVLATVLASYLPARRASAVDPAETLAAE
jgi:predicted permease